MSSELLVSHLGGITWAALREEGVTVELRVERERERGAVGRIVKARVTKILPGIQSAFLDIGVGRDAFLHVADLVLPEERLPKPGDEAELGDLLEAEDDEGIEEGSLLEEHPRRVPAPRGGPIEDRLKEGRELIVQVTREGIGSKGARVTCLVALPGRYLVCLPFLAFRGLSRRITDPEERERLRAMLASMPPGPGGLIVRTAGEGIEEPAFRADAEMLAKEWESIQAKAATALAPAVLHTELDLVRRLVRDVPWQGLERIVLDSPEAYESVVRYVAELDPLLASRVRLHTGPLPLFESLGLDQDIEKALRPRVWLRSGGYIVIQQTEALVSIDVNTGKYVGTRNAEDTVLRTNLEAAGEIARQLRLRDLGGIIVVDFIDMEDPASRRQVLDAFEEALRKDRARTKIVGLSELGLVQLTRKRTRPGVETLVTRPCPVCAGQGRLRSPEMVARHAVAEILRLLEDAGTAGVTLRAQPDVAAAVRLALQTAGPLIDGARFDRIRIEDDPEAPPEDFGIVAV